MGCPSFIPRALSSCSVGPGSAQKSMALAADASSEGGQVAPEATQHLPQQGCGCTKGPVGPEPGVQRSMPFIILGLSDSVDARARVCLSSVHASEGCLCL